MGRRVAQSYRSRAIGQLTRQLLFAPPDKRVEQVLRAEKLHDQIDPKIAYPFEFVSYRITRYRTESKDESLMQGESILPDLRLLIDTLSQSVGMPATKDDPVESPEALAKRLQVSTRTVARWRMMGLRWRWAATKGGGPRKLVLARSAVERFLAQNKQRVERAAKFSKIDPQMRAKLITRARRIAEGRGVSLNQVATHLARRTGRAIETIRMILEKHDAAHPKAMIFADRTGPLTAKQKRVIVRAHRKGVATVKMVRHFKRTRTTIHRVLRDHRAAAIRRLEIRCVPSPIFSREDADEVILRPEPPPEDIHSHASDAGPSVNDLPEPLRVIFSVPTLAADRERSLLVRFNYLKFKAQRLQENLDRREPRVAELDQIELWLKQAEAIRRRLVSAHQRVVLSVARKHMVGHSEASLNHLMELLELSQDVLAEALDSHDAAKGQSFEAYLTWSLMRRFASHQADRAKAHRRPDAEALARRILGSGSVE